MELSRAIKQRKSIKKFSHKIPSWKKIIRCIDMARLAPTAGNLHTIKYILIQDSEIINKIADAAQQDFIKDAPFVVAVISDREKVKKTYDYNNKGFAAQQAGAAIENFLLALAEQGLAHCWVGFFDDNLMAEAIKTPSEQTIEAIIPIGKASKLKKHPDKSKPDLENVIYFDYWNNEHMEPQTKVRKHWS